MSMIVLYKLKGAGSEGWKAGRLAIKELTVIKARN